MEILKTYGVINKYQMDIIIRSNVWQQIIMKIQLYQGVKIKLLNFGQKRMNGCVYKQQMIILIAYQDQVQINNKIELSHVEMIKIQQQQNNQDRIQSGTEQYGYRVCFIDNNMFTFSQRDKEQISVFEMNPNNKQFTKIRDITIKSGKDNVSRFPKQYINSKCILVSKNGEYVNLIRKQQNGEFRTEQSIHFGINSLYGVMSDDGEYSITWDDKSNIIQIRRYKEQ
ncbi:unnamed protein product [Paramecium pentaurelia]|uniref:Uncharacterized protein n=1 Tax=Paramecium pentaurelia TaxID=43138 RepID=A0A8S1WQ51_9CILI|nr:unnamed protein product [Paramecium pentaurelia]